MTRDTSCRLAALRSMTAAQLRAEWQVVIGTVAPNGFGKDMLACGIAYHVQERLQGGMLLTTARQLAEAKKQLARGEVASPRTRLQGITASCSVTRLARNRAIVWKSGRAPTGTDQHSNFSARAGA